MSNLPTLEDNRYLRFAAFAILYAAQGLPWGLFVTAIPAWLSGKGYSAGDIGTFIAIAGLPWSFKLVAGPLMDRYTFLAMGRRRPWVIGAQVGIVIGMIVLAFAPDPANNVMLIAWIGFFINSFCALQDVAVDGMAIDILHEDERARANAFMYGGQIVGISIAASGGTYLLSNIGLGAASAIIGVAILLIMIVAICLRERQGEKVLPWTEGKPSESALTFQAGDFKSIFVNLFRVLILPMSILLVVVEFLNRASAGLFLAITPVVTVQEIGWADTTYSNWQASAGIAAAILGVFVAPWIDRKGATLALSIAIGFRLVLFAFLGLVPSLWNLHGAFETLIVLNSLSGQIVTVSIIALFMNICAPHVAATQFAVYMASANLALSAGSGLVALIDPYLDYAGMYLVGAGLNLLFLVLWPFFNLESHKGRIAGLEPA
jgi:PAT family beta-lactamase induction signal transducer AmpG